MFIVTDDFINRGNHNAPRTGILDAVHGRRDDGIHIRLFKTKIGIDHFTVNQLQRAAVTKRLGTEYSAMFKSEVVGIPAEEFPAKHAVSDGNIMRVPKGVPAGNIAMLKNGIMQVLQRIFSSESHIAECERAT